MTWTNGTSYSRIDRIYVKQENNSFLKSEYNNVINTLHSDHKAITAKIKINVKIKKIIRQKSWKLNYMILEAEIGTQKFLGVWVLG